MKMVNKQASGVVALLCIMVMCIVHAPVAHAGYFGDIDTFGNNITGFFNSVLVPLIFAIALVVFIWGVFKYLILGGGDEDSRSDGKALMLWAIIGFVVMVIIFGIVNFLAAGLSDGLGVTDRQQRGLENRPTVPVPN